MPLKVLHIASGDLWAGAEVMLHALATAQHRIPDLQVIVILFNEGRLAEELRRSGVRVVVLPESRLNLVQLILRTRATVRAERPDIVHTHRSKEDLVGAVAATFLCGVPCVRTVHGIDEVALAGLNLQRKLARKVHAIGVEYACRMTYVVARSLQEEFARSLGSERVCYMANGVDIEAIRSLNLASPTTSSPIRIGFVGRLVPVKRVDLFLRMAALLREKAPTAFRFDIYGDGPEEPDLKALATQLGMMDIVYFHGFSASIAKHLVQLDMLYLTSDSEGLPMVVLEAMVLGVPVVAHAVGEIPAVLEQGRCGTLVEAHNAEGYAAEALAYLENPDEFKLKAAKAKIRVEAHYSAEASAKNYRVAYARVLAS